MCVSKYLSKPEGIEILYETITKSRFPSFTFCSNNWNKLPPNRYNQEVLKNCNLTQNDYGIGGKYATPECNDPKALQQDVGLEFNELEIWGLKVTTFDRYLDGIMWADISNDTYFEWSNSFLDHNRGRCHTISFKESSLSHGLSTVRNRKIILWTKT